MFVVSCPELFMALYFPRLGPLHTFYALAAIACGFSGLLMMVFAALGLRSRWVGARAWMLLAFVIGGGILGTLGYSNGREYVSWAPLLSPRPDERRGGKESGSMCRYRWSQYQ